jgi:hypothetical protein
MTFWSTTNDPTRDARNVLLAATQSGEMIMLSAPDTESTSLVTQSPSTANPTTKYATKGTRKRDLPTLSEMKAEVTATTSTSIDLSLLSTSERAKSFLNSSSSFFSETSSKMPSVSVLFDGYMRNALSKKRKLTEVTTDNKNGPGNQTSDENNNFNKTNKYTKKSKKNNFADPQFRQNINSQLFGAFSKSKNLAQTKDKKGNNSKGSGKKQAKKAIVTKEEVKVTTTTSKVATPNKKQKQEVAATEPQQKTPKKTKNC